MRIIYFDLCAIFIYLIILWTCISRRLTRENTNRLFLLMSVLSLICSILDAVYVYTTYPVPLSAGRAAAGMAITFFYLALRNLTPVVYLVMLFSMTRTEFRLRPRFVRLLIEVPYLIVLALLVLNFFTRNVYSVTMETGYTRQPLMLCLYGIAMLYVLVGFGYCLYCRRYLVRHKWVSLVSVYLLNMVAVMIQFVRPDLLVEMFATACGLLMILLQAMRPEESIDSTLDVRSWKAYQADLANLLKTGQNLNIIVTQITNAYEVRSYLGDNRYDALIGRGLKKLEESLPQESGMRIDVYFERPGIIYVLVENCSISEEAIQTQTVQLIDQNMRSKREGILLKLKACLIRCPEDLSSFKDIITFGHRFPLLGTDDTNLYRACDLMTRRDFNVINHTEEILSRAIKEHSVEVYYQPIYDLRKKSFHSAEALARLKDPAYGMISPAIFIPAAEKSGLIIPLGEQIIEAVFRFLSENDLRSLGLDSVEINLSIAQCMDRKLYDTVLRLQTAYGIDPALIRFELTETTFDNIGETGQNNLKKLSKAGYGFALDDYGIGYTNIQRLSRLAFDIIKIDKSMVDELETSNGELIMRNTIHMMHDLHKHIVIEGVETEHALVILQEMAGDFIQGYYYSRPLPEQAYLSFLKPDRDAEQV